MTMFSLNAILYFIVVSPEYFHTATILTYGKGIIFSDGIEKDFLNFNIVVQLQKSALRMKKQI